MSTQNPNLTNMPADIDLEDLRIPATYGATLGVKKLLTKVPVGKPKKPQFFRTYDSAAMTFPAVMLEDKEARENYILVPAVAQELATMALPVQLHVAIDRQNNLFLIPVPLPNESGNRNSWHESLNQAVEHSKQHWIRIAANMAVGGYDVFQAEGALPEPDWPSYSINELIQVAFRGKIITNLSHPVVQALLGRA